MQLILVRHGEAGIHRQDSQRELTERGQAQAVQTAAFICQNYSPDALVVSPYIRAQQTMQALATKLPDVPVTVFENITPLDDHHQAIDDLLAHAEAKQAECVVVVCHMDIVARMCAALTGDGFVSYALAEARVLEQTVIAEGLSKQVTHFIPDAG